MEGSIPVGTIVALVAGIVSTLVGAYVALFRHALAQERKELDRRLDDLSKAVVALEATAMGHALLEARVEGNTEKLVEITSTMVTKEVFALRLQTVIETTNNALAFVRSLPASGSNYRSVRQPPIPRNDPDDPPSRRR